MRQDRRKARAAELTREDKENDDHIVSAAIEHTEGFDTTIKGKYGIWRREYENPNSDSTLKLMQDQIIMAKAYANIAKSKNKIVLYEALIKHSRDSQQAIGEASSDTELHLGYFCISLVFFLWLIRFFSIFMQGYHLLHLLEHLIEQKLWVMFFP